MQYAMNGDGVKMAIYWSFENTAKKNRSTSMLCEIVVYHPKKMEPPYQDVNKKSNTLAKEKKIIWDILLYEVHCAYDNKYHIHDIVREGERERESDKENITAIATTAMACHTKQQPHISFPLCYICLFYFVSRP